MTLRMLGATGLLALGIAGCQQDDPLAGTAAPPATIPAFTIKDLGVLPGTPANATSQAYAATTTTVVGYATDAAGKRRAVYFAGGTATQLQEPAGAASSETRGVSVKGIVGFASVSGQTEALYWPSVTAPPVVLPTLGGNFASARSINSAGEILGTAETADGDTVAVVWNNAVVSRIDSTGGVGFTPVGINDDGKAAGNAGADDAATGVAGGGGFFWEGGGDFTSITPFVDDADIDVNGLSNSGVVVGGVTVPGNPLRAFRWTLVRGMVPLGDPPAGYALVSASGANDSLWVAGTATNVNASGTTTAGVVAVTAALELDRQFTALPGLGGTRSGMSDNGMTPCGVILGWSFPSGSTSRHAVAWVPPGCSTP